MADSPKCSIAKRHASDEFFRHFGLNVTNSFATSSKIVCGLERQRLVAFGNPISTWSRRIQKRFVAKKDRADAGRVTRKSLDGLRQKA
jgi:hypothetical protein